MKHVEYEFLERALVTHGRLAIMRQGKELVIVPERLRIIAGREALEARHPSTGDSLTIFIDELDSLSPVSPR